MKGRFIAMLGVTAGIALLAAVAFHRRQPETKAVKGVIKDRAGETIPSAGWTSSVPERTETMRPSPNAAMPAIPPPKIDTIPASLHAVMGQDEKDNYFTRIKAVHRLGKNLSQDEITALYVLLYRKKGEDKLPLDHLNAIKNDVVSLLRKQDAKPADLVRHLITMFRDPGFDGVWRDYCVQHLGQWYQKVDGGEEKQAVRDLLWNATGETGVSIAGTALIALCNNADQPEMDKGRIAMKALALSEDPKCGELAKITALQICAKMGEKQVLPVAREIAASSASVPLRMSAIAAVGTLGEESDRPLLEKYASSSDGRLRTAAQSALKRLWKERSGDAIESRNK